MFGFLPIVSVPFLISVIKYFAKSITDSFFGQMQTDTCRQARQAGGESPGQLVTFIQSGSKSRQKVESGYKTLRSTSETHFLQVSELP